MSVFRLLKSVGGNASLKSSENCCEAACKALICINILRLESLQKLAIFELCILAIIA